MVEGYTQAEIVTGLMQVRYMLRDFNVKQPGCGLDKLAVFVEDICKHFEMQNSSNNHDTHGS